MASVRLAELKKSSGGAERGLLDTLRLLEPRDFRLQGRDALIEFLHGKVIETLSDLMRRRRFSWRRAENLIIISNHGEPPRLAVKTMNFEYCITLHWNRAMCCSNGCPGLGVFTAVRCKQVRETYASSSGNRNIC